MKVSEFKTIIESIVSEEVKKHILNESNESNKEVYHIKCEGIPLASFDSEEEAKEQLPTYQKKHKGELIIEKGSYESHDDMLDKLDEMNDQLEETDNMENTEKQPMEGNEFSGALKAAKDAGDKKFTVDGKEYDVDECWGKQMEEELIGGQKKLDKNHNGEIDGQDFKIMQGQKDGEEECDECGGSDMKEEEGEEDPTDQILKMAGLGSEGVTVTDGGGEESTPEEDVTENKQVCDECGGLMNEEGKCGECNKIMHESKKKTIRLKESELIKLITKMVNESIPGLDAYTKAHKESGKENKDAMGDAEKTMKDYLSFEGNDNPEFPKAIGKGEKVARKNTPEQEEEIKKNFAGLENLDYDAEPDEKFKKRLKMAIEGDTTMGNAPTTEKASIKPSNGADKGDESKDKDGNSIPTPETAKGIEKQVKDREKDKKERVLYAKEKVPVSESKVNFKSVLEEEIQKMKKIYGYDEKTQ